MTTEPLGVPEDDVEIVEVYVPRRLEYLSGLYAWLRSQLDELETKSLFRGFSLYEVAGAYQGSRLYTEQTLVVRLVFDLSESWLPESQEARIESILNEIVRITNNQEEEVWIIRVPGRKRKWVRGSQA